MWSDTSEVGRSVGGCRLPFETLVMCGLPRESRLCVTLVGVRVVQSTSSEASHRVNVPLGWVTTQLYNQQLYVDLVVWLGHDSALQPAVVC